MHQIDEETAEMHQIDEETAEKMITTEEYLKLRQAALNEKAWNGDHAEEPPYALKLAELICV